MSDRPWYKRYPSNFLSGTSELTVEEKGAYSTIIDLIYDRRGPLANDAMWLGRVMGCPTKRANQLVHSLVARGKISFTDDGRITCTRAVERMEHEAAESAALRQNGAKGGQKAAENRAKLPPKVAQVAAETGNNNDLASGGLPVVPETRYQISTLTPSESVRAQRKRGSRITTDWRPSADGIQEATNLGLDPEAVLLKFRDYWLAEAGQKASKLDWDATWRNWCRTEAERRPRPANVLPLLTPIEGGKAKPADDPNDSWGINAFCIAVGAKPTTEPAHVEQGKWLYENRWIVDGIARKIAEAAGFKRTWRGDWSPLVQWLRDGFKARDQIIPAVKDFTEFLRSKGEFPHSVRAFDSAVRKRQAAA